MKYLKTYESFESLDITRIIQEEIAEFGLSPIEINSGDCYNFAESIAAKYGDQIVCLNGQDFFESFDS